MTQAINPDFESKHARGQGGKFTSMPKNENKVELAGDQYDKFLDAMEEYHQREFGMSPTHEDEQECQALYEDMATEMIPVIAYNHSGPTGDAGKTVVVIDDNGRYYEIYANSEHSITTDDGRVMTVQEWVDASPARDAELDFPKELGPNMDDDDEYYAWEEDQDRFVINKYDQVVAAGTYSEDEFAKRQREHDENIARQPLDEFDYDEHEEYVEKYNLWKELAPRIEQRRRDLDTASFNVVSQANVKRDRPHAIPEYVDYDESEFRTFKEMLDHGETMRNLMIANTRPEDVEFEDERDRPTKK